MPSPNSLNPESLEQGVAYLCSIDADLRRIKTELGSPPLWSRQPGFPTLVHIILEQQVSLASARAAMDKLEAALAEVTPSAFLSLRNEELKRIGFSWQKASYCRGLAQAIMDNVVDLAHIAGLDDASARTALIKIKGIGPWTADIYLLMALLRPDIWPSGDLALAAAVQELKGLPSRLGVGELNQLALSWKPWRAVAARLLWHYYLRPK